MSMNHPDNWPLASPHRKEEWLFINSIREGGDTLIDANDLKIMSSLRNYHQESESIANMLLLQRLLCKRGGPTY